MNSPHVLEHLPLWVEGDLGESETAVIDGHLAECSACREAAEDLRRSQAWLREAMASPFEARDRDRLRRAVMDRIRAEAALPPSPRFLTRPALLAACAASLLVASLAWWLPRDRGQAPTMVRVAPAPDGTLGPSGRTPQPITAVPRISPSPQIRVTQARIAPVPTHETESPPSEPARIEFQTADPTIRIIWLAQAKPMPETTPFPEEP